MFNYLLHLIQFYLNFRRSYSETLSHPNVSNSEKANNHVQKNLFVWDVEFETMIEGVFLHKHI